MAGRKKASEIEIAQAVRNEVSQILAPIEAWDNIATPDVYLESRSGLYLSGLEKVLEAAVQMNDLAMVRATLLDLLKMTKMGRPKADLNIGGVNKLRYEEDFSQVNTDDLKKLLGKGSLE